MKTPWNLTQTDKQTKPKQTDRQIFINFWLLEHRYLELFYLFDCNWNRLIGLSLVVDLFVWSWIESIGKFLYLLIMIWLVWLLVFGDGEFWGRCELVFGDGVFWGRDDCELLGRSSVFKMLVYLFSHVLNCLVDLVSIICLIMIWIAFWLLNRLTDLFSMVDCRLID